VETVFQLIVQSLECRGFLIFMNIIACYLIIIS
jgi:hypothetical protein